MEELLERVRRSCQWRECDICEVRSSLVNLVETKEDALYAASMSITRMARGIDAHLARMASNMGNLSGSVEPKVLLVIASSSVMYLRTACTSSSGSSSPMVACFLTWSWCQWWWLL